MTKILKASAGSGKTFHLALEYIRILLGSDEPDIYRHILAVTFTNKATDEMKRRILKELYTLATTPQESRYRDLLVPSTVPDDETLKRKSGIRLSSILHDYGAFSVSTIDRFFQQTLRAFSHEIGQFSSYQVELDREGLVNETIDRILDSLTEKDRSLLGWLTDSVMADLENNSRFNLEAGLKKIAVRLKSEQHEELVKAWGIDEGKVFSKENLRRIQSGCGKIISSFRERVKEAAKAALDVLEAEGIDPSDSNRGFLAQLYKFSTVGPRDEIDMPTKAFMDKAGDSSKWFAASKDRFRLRLEGKLEGPLGEFTALFDKAFKEYRTALLVRRQIYGLGIAGELREEFAALQKEKNVLSIEDSNMILRDIIDGSDTPFIYEKMGVRFEDFLLDEFQDTSAIQWANFRPLVHDSDAAGGANLAVGDVKQSIYRWRGSDWHMLQSGLQEEFPRATLEPLGENYRTLGGIVNFNGSFFDFAARAVDEVIGGDEVAGIYSDARQVPRLKDPAPGLVDVVFTPEGNIVPEVIDSIRKAVSLGFRYEDIAILVRWNKEGSEIASALVEAGIPVISDDSLFVKSSVTVRRLVSQMALVDEPGSTDSVAGFLASSMEMEIPSSYNSLIDLAEALLRSIRHSFPEAFKAETPYIQAFMDYLLNWAASGGGNNLKAFLRDWEADSPKIASPEGGDSVRVMTVHKAKGLEFPLVIFPFAEKVTLFRPSRRWCHPAVEGTAMEDFGDAAFDVELSGKSANTLFGDDYDRERRLQAIDNINVFYVALTRPVLGLKVISATPPAKITGPSRSHDWTNMSQILYAFASDSEDMAYSCDGDTVHFKLGEMPDPAKVRREGSAAVAIDPGYPSFPINADGGRPRLLSSSEAADYFGPDGQVGMDASPRLRGLALHKILSSVTTASDLPSATEALVLSGEVAASERTTLESFLAGKIASVRDLGWFPCGEGWKVLNEVPLIGTDGEVYRPDRVVISPSGEATVIDYKFPGHADIPPSQAEGYRRQVRRYMGLFSAMGYGPVSGFLWYIREGGGDCIDKVSERI